MAFTMMLPMILNTMGTRLNSGSFSEPEMGKSKSITPCLSASKATASFTGRLAGAPGTASPKVSWFSTSWLRAVSWPLGNTA